jgi:hypothetical protein
MFDTKFVGKGLTEKNRKQFLNLYRKQNQEYKMCKLLWSLFPQDDTKRGHNAVSLEWAILLVKCSYHTADSFISLWHFKWGVLESLIPQGK